jgi:hypothetical protein
MKKQDKLLVLKERLWIYQFMLKIINSKVGFCWMYFYAIREKEYIDTGNILIITGDKSFSAITCPEIWEHKPEENQAGFYWFPKDEEGITIRKKILRHSIEQVEIKIREEEWRQKSFIHQIIAAIKKILKRYKLC